VVRTSVILDPPVGARSRARGGPLESNQIDASDLAIAVEDVIVLILPRAAFAGDVIPLLSDQPAALVSGTPSKTYRNETL
jgi:hypothetical protein